MIAAYYEIEKMIPKLQQIENETQLPCYCIAYLEYEIKNITADVNDVFPTEIREVVWREACRLRGSCQTLTRKNGMLCFSSRYAPVALTVNPDQIRSVDIYRPEKKDYSYYEELFDRSCPEIIIEAQFWQELFRRTGDYRDKELFIGVYGPTEPFKEWL